MEMSHMLVVRREDQKEKKKRIYIKQCNVKYIGSSNMGSTLLIKKCLSLMAKV